MTLDYSAAIPSRRALLTRIEHLDTSADAKVLLARLLDITIDTGGRLIAIGRRILAFVLEVVRAFPNTAFGAVMALAVSMLIAGVPIFGAVLGPLLSPLLLAFGLTMGAVADIRGGAIGSRVDEWVAHIAGDNSGE